MTYFSLPFTSNTKFSQFPNLPASQWSLFLQLLARLGSVQDQSDYLSQELLTISLNADYGMTMSVETTGPLESFIRISLIFSSSLKTEDLLGVTIAITILSHPIRSDRIEFKLNRNEFITITHDLNDHRGRAKVE